MDLVPPLWRQCFGVDCFRQRDVEVATDRVRPTAVDNPLIAASLDHDFSAIGKIWAPLAVDRHNPLRPRRPNRSYVTVNPFRSPGPGECS